jgi:Phage Tail Collar Domain/Tectonin domain
MTLLATGSVIAFCGTADHLAALATQGWLKCDGSSVSRQTYPELYTMIGTIHGGNGSPNFNLPDLRGYFLRGVDDQHSSRDPDRGSRLRPGSNQAVGANDPVGSTQQDQLRHHPHNWDHFFHDITNSGDDIAVHQAPSSGGLQNRTEQATNVDGGGAETRPRNVYVYYLIASGTLQLAGITQLSDGTLLGIGADLQLYTRHDLYSSWVNIPDSAAVVSVTQLRDGTILGAGTDHKLYTRASLTSPWVQIPNSGDVVSVSLLADGRILGVGTDTNLYTRATLTSQWVQIPTVGGINGAINATQLLDGRILAVGTDKFAYTRADLTSGGWWVQVPNSYAVTAVAQLNTGLILAVGLDKWLYARGTTDAPNWVHAT